MSTLRVRVGDALLHTAVDLAADRERLTRSMNAERADRPGYELAASSMALAGWVDSALFWLSARLRPRVRFGSSRTR
jgi:hypothetical protein